MAKAKNKTVQNEGSVDDYMSAIAPDTRREDCEAVLAMMREVTGWEPKMWGTSIVGFGEYHYKYESGREGSHLRLGFSSRAQSISIYIMPGYQDFSEELAQLGKHKIGKSCLYIKRMSDVDAAVLKRMLQKGLDLMAEKYPLEN